MALQFVPVEPVKLSAWQRFKISVDRLWLWERGRYYIRLYPNPGFRIGSLCWGKRQGFFRRK